MNHNVAQPTWFDESCYIDTMPEGWLVKRKDFFHLETPTSMLERLVIKIMKFFTNFQQLREAKP